MALETDRARVAQRVGGRKGESSQPTATHPRRTLSEPKHESAEYVEDGETDECKLDGRADSGERWSEAAAIAGEREQQGNVFTRVERGGGEREERDHDARGREATPAPFPCVPFCRLFSLEATTGIEPV